jgi:hypothetical protein
MPLVNAYVGKIGTTVKGIFPNAGNACPYGNADKRREP